MTGGRRVRGGASAGLIGRAAAATAREDPIATPTKTKVKGDDDDDEGGGVLTSRCEL